MIVILLCFIFVPWLIHFGGGASTPETVQSTFSEKIKALLGNAFGQGLGKGMAKALVLAAVGSIAVAGVTMAAGSQPPVGSVILHEDDAAGAEGEKGDKGDQGDAGKDGSAGRLAGVWIAILLVLSSITLKLFAGARERSALKTRVDQDGHEMHVITAHRLKTLETVGAGADVIEVLKLRLGQSMSAEELIQWLEKELGRERVQEKIEIVRRYTRMTG